MKRILILAGLLVGLAGNGWTREPPLAPSTVSASDAIAIHIAVQSQLEALAEDDAAGAFALATKDTQSKIGSPERFLDLVKEHYTPMYRHQFALFSNPEVIDGQTIQVVRLTDPDRKVWVAVYRMEPAGDGTWKIDGCQLLETTTIAV